MANAVKWDAAATSGTDLLTTELNSLADNVRTAVGTEYANQTNLNQYGWFVLEATWAISPDDDVPHCKLYLVRKFDGTAYDDGSASVVPSPDALVGAFHVQGATAAQNLVIGPVLLPPFAFKLLLENQTGQALPASGSTVAIHVANDEVQ